MALRGQVVEFVRLRLLHDVEQVGRVRQVAVMQHHLRMIHMRILVDVIDPRGVEER